MNTKVAWSMCRYILSLVLVLIVGVAVFIWWALGTTLPSRSDLAVSSINNPPIVPVKDPLVVASYNIGHGQGIKENAWDYRNKAVTEQQLSLIADAMIKIDADIWLLQEVDLNSHRTFRINQIDFIKERTKHAYHACAIVWEKNYLPFPYWPPAHHLGFVRAANCVLSRYPLSNHQRIIFDKPASNPFWYNWGYIDRGIERVDVSLGDKVIALLNLHLEAWELAARELQIEKTLNYIDEIKVPIILGGDFNTVMPDAKKTSGFIDDKDANYANEKTLSWFFAHAKDVKIPHLTAEYSDPFHHYTFPSNAPDRRLDHIFLLGTSLSFVSFRVGFEAGIASDHLPVIAVIDYK